MGDNDCDGDGKEWWGVSQNESSAWAIWVAKGLSATTTMTIDSREYQLRDD
jgi:hypothetical protein